MLEPPNHNIQRRQQHCKISAGEEEGGWGLRGVFSGVQVADRHKLSVFTCIKASLLNSQRSRVEPKKSLTFALVWFVFYSLDSKLQVSFAPPPQYPKAVLRIPIRAVFLLLKYN